MPPDLPVSLGDPRGQRGLRSPGRAWTVLQGSVRLIPQHPSLFSWAHTGTAHPRPPTAQHTCS